MEGVRLAPAVVSLLDMLIDIALTGVEQKADDDHQDGVPGDVPDTDH